jgi:ATP-dependent Clp protease ATP-binding subunit ClpA
VRFTAAAIRACVDLSHRHVNDRFLPDKAIDVLDETGAAVRLRPGKERKTVGVRDVEAVVARMANIPAVRASSSDKKRLENLEQELRSVVFGQDAAISTVVRAVKRGRAGSRASSGRSAASCSRARPASARPSCPSSSRRRSACRSCAST